MKDADLRQRLSQMSTSWTLIAQAHGSVDAEVRAQAALIERYQGAVYRYLLGILKDADAADELFQEFSLRVVRGDFHKADAGRGRFRSYLKTALIHLVHDYRGRQARRQVAPLEEPEAVAAPAESLAPEDDRAFLDGWRKTLLDRAWDSLRLCQKPGGPPFHDALRLKTEEPDLSGAELTERLNRELKPNPPLTDANLRKVVQRARDMFTDCVVDEVARSLRTTDLDAIEQELIDLGFHAYCQKALERRRAM